MKKQTVPGYAEETAWYHISVPKEYGDTRNAVPLIIFLHGGHYKEGTADNIVSLAQVVPAFKANIVVFPNHLKTWWAHPKEMKYLLDTLDEIMRKWKIDPKRIYLMGGSMGGNGVWAFGSRCPELFAALAPISGWYADNLGFPLADLKGKPVYIAHGTKDKTVPISGAKRAYEILKPNGTNVVFREIDCDHQPPVEEFAKAADWLLKYSNQQDFNLDELKKRVDAMPVPGWLTNLQ